METWIPVSYTHLCKYFSKSLMDSYVTLYSEGRIASSLVRGYYLGSIITKNNMVGVAGIHGAKEII